MQTLPRPSDLGSHSRGLSKQTPPSKRKGCARAVKEDKEITDRPLAPCGGSGVLPALGKVPATRTRTHGPSEHDKTLCSNGEKSPWRSKPTPPGPRGLHPVGALAHTHWNHQVQNTIPNRSCCEPSLDKTSGECPHSSRGSGATVGYHKKGYPKQEPKMLLKPCKNQTARSQQILRFARGHASRPQAKGQKLPTLAEAPPRKASDGMPILRFARGWARQTTSLPPSRPNSSGKTSRPG